MKHGLIFIMALYTANVFAGYGGYVGQYDNRSYGNLSDSEYSGIVKLTTDSGGRCTGGFISKNLIITNDHCALKCKNRCTAEFWNGSGYEKSNVKAVVYYTQYGVQDGTDWAILLSDKDSKFYKSIMPQTTSGQVLRGGYGTLRIIEDSEIPYLQNLYSEAVQKYNRECKTLEQSKKTSFFECVNHKVEQQLKNSGKKPLFGDVDNFKVQKCNILRTIPGSANMVETDCDSSGGDSGAPLLRSAQIVGLNNSGLQSVFGNGSVNANALKTENFYTQAQSAIAKYSVDNTSGNGNTNNNNTVNNNTANNNGNNNNTNNANNQTNNNIVNNNPNNGSNNNSDQQLQLLLEQRLQDLDCD